MKELFIDRDKEILRIAVKNKGKLEKLYIEEEEKEPIQGEIYKGIVRKVIPNLKSAFVDIGFKKNAYMYIDNKFNNSGIKNGDEVIVEVLKEGTREKGPKVTTMISIQGKYVVLDTSLDRIKFSSKIDTEIDKDSIVKEIVKPKDIGVIIRTKALESSVSDINKEIGILYDIYSDILKKGQFSLKPSKIYDGGGTIGKVLRNILEEDVKIILNDKKDYDNVIEMNLSKNCDFCDINYYEENIPMFEKYGIESEILKLRNKKVKLPCGGDIVIEKTEAMTVIDVNTGKNVKGKNVEKAIFDTNVEAAKEIGRQILLRNISGIVAIDFINMTSKKYKKIVIDILRDYLKEDNSKFSIVDFNELNIVHISRMKKGKSILEYIDERCSVCHGKGSVLKFSYLKMLMKNEITRQMKEYLVKEFHIAVNKSYKDIIEDKKQILIDEYKNIECDIYITYTNEVDTYKVEPIIFENMRKKLEDFKITK
ncbi:ribonuclease E/G [Clostridium bornimense]|uniref:ribonuclease E/G n=2 Tax=Clostridium TaxID=1485 RepID=UPI001C115EC5|nr:ribonuclease E/G [Clostridium bornimense]MBU5315781.1 ribonuclease E/G [Clostridium bornimense]